VYTHTHKTFYVPSYLQLQTIPFDVVAISTATPKLNEKKKLSRVTRTAPFLQKFRGVVFIDKFEPK